MLHQTIYSSWKFKENVLLGVSWEWKDEANINATLCTWTWSKWRSTINCQCNLSECSKHVHMWLTWHENFKHVWTKIYYWFRGLSWERNGFYYIGVTEGCRKAGTVALTILDDNFFFSFFFSFLIKTNFEKLNLIFQIVSNSRTRQDVKCLWCCFNLGEE